LYFDGLVESQPASPAHPALYNITPSVGTPLGEAIYSRYDYNGNGRLDPETQQYNPPVNAISPFKVDPDTENTGQSFSKGLLRDVDVLLNKNVWEQDEENVLVTGSDRSPGRYELPPVNWSTNALFTLSIGYMRSFDVHVDMEAGDPDSWDERYLDHPVTPIHDGLWIDSYFNVTKARSGAWQGVVTIPYDTIGDIPTVFFFYKKTVGNEFHQYSFGLVPEHGEDVGLSVGFDKLEFKSSTREFAAAYLEDPNNPSFEETIAITPDGAPYGNFYVPPFEYDSNAVREQARVLAVGLLSGRLKFPTALNGGTPSYKAITNEESENGGTRVEIYGIVATYDTIVATLNTP
jgi:hypothetical protein